MMWKFVPAHFRAAGSNTALGRRRFENDATEATRAAVAADGVSARACDRDRAWRRASTHRCAPMIVADQCAGRSGVGMVDATRT
jgi:hypothetical protein